MFSRSWATVLGACVALSMIAFMGTSGRQKVAHPDWGSTSISVDSRHAPPQPRPDPTAKTQPPAKSEAKVLLDEDFDGNAIDTSTWNTCHWWHDNGCTISSNRELEWYLPQQATVSDGALHLTADHSSIFASDGRHYSFTSGMVTTGPPAYTEPSKLAFTYGKVEVRFRLPDGRGLWPAIWMLPASEESEPEIDLLEVLGHEPGRLLMRLHTKETESESIGKNYALPKGYSLADAWHTIALDWSPGKLVFFLDGREVWTLESEHVPDEPMYLVMNLAVGGDFPGDPDQTTEFPSVFSIDRVWIRSHE
jgi:beta-glucanase (GH16 family)